MGLTREEAKELFRSDKDGYGKPKAVMTKINAIYDDFNKELDKARKEGYRAAADDCFILLAGKE